MRILIKILLLSITTLSPLAADSIKDSFGLVELKSDFQYVDPTLKINDLLNSEEEWTPLKDGKIHILDKALWIKIPVKDLRGIDKYYLTEHKGLKAWEYYLIKDDTVISQGELDWGNPHGLDPREAISYRTFSFTSFPQNLDPFSTIYIKLKPRYTRNFRFILRTEKNFSQALQNWSMVQGAGIGSLFMLILFSLLFAVKLRYKVSSFFFVLTIFSGLNILFISGVGPYFHSWIFPSIPHILWYMLISFFSSMIIMYIQRFIELKSWGRKIQLYFRFILILSLFLVSLIPLFPVKSLFMFLNFQSIFMYAAIVAGLIYLVRKGSLSARWLLAGWILYYIVTSMGYFLSTLDDGRVFFSSLSFYLGQGFLILLFGAGLILEIEEKHQDEIKKRKDAEFANIASLSRLTENERMAELGRLVASVTHELGTPLGVGVTLSTTISSEAADIKKKHKKGDLSEEDFLSFLSGIQESSDLVYHNMLLARTLIRGFKDVAADQAAPDIREIKLKEYTDKILAVLEPGFKYNSTVIESLIDPQLSIVSIPGILTQVLNNLINNAVFHGLEDNPESKISLESNEIEDSVVISVRDTGKGIPFDIQERIFDIYFTTKKGKGGTGVGLSIVRSLVEENLKGKLSFQSTEGEGSVFHVTLPKDISKI